MVDRVTICDGHVTRVAAGGAVTNVPNGTTARIRNRGATGSFAARAYFQFDINGLPSSGITDSLVIVHVITPLSNVDSTACQIWYLDVQPNQANTTPQNIWDAFDTAIFPNSVQLTTFLFNQAPVTNLGIDLNADSHIAGKRTAGQTWYTLGILFPNDLATAGNERNVRISPLEMGNASVPCPTLRVV